MGLLSPVIDKPSRYSEKGKSLWNYIQSLSSQGEIRVEIPAQEGRKGRTAVLKLRFGSFKLNPPRNHIRHKTEKLPDLNLYAVHVLAENCPENEWKILYLKIYAQKPLPTGIPTVQEVVRWIAQLGGFLGRKRNGEPGPIALWRGWMRFCDLAEGWSLAMRSTSCG